MLRLGSAANYGEEESARLYELAQEQAGLWVIEIGVWQGYTSLIMAAGSAHRPETRVLSVDRWIPTSGTKGASGDWVAALIDLRIYLRIAADTGLLSRIVPLRMASVEAAGVWPIEAGLAGLIHLDATHTYDEVMADVRAWVPHLASGGVMAFHDYYPAYPGVMKAVDELSGEACWTDQRVTGCTAEMRYMPEGG
jgi:cephalosporin hydroxylase